jgi:hypothetical protein
MFSPEITKAIRGFATHGVDFERQSGDQCIGASPFNGKSGKFFVNWKNRLWDDKLEGLKGNYQQFLEAIALRDHETVKADDSCLKGLAQDRGLPRQAFKLMGVGWNGGEYTFPVFNSKKTVIDIRHYTLGKRIMSTANCDAGLFGLPALLDPKRLKETVYICEGEWDAIALNWLLWKLEKPGVVVGVPGAGTFKPEWVPHFKDRHVVALYDNDTAGEQGELRCYQMLKPACKVLKFARWPEEVPVGFDTRDWVCYAIKHKILRKCWRKLQLLMVYDKPRQAHEEASEAAEETEETAASIEPISRTRLIKVYQKWLHMENDEPLAVMFGTLIANRLEGDPLWMFMVAPPGGMKSELLMSLGQCERVYACSSLTPHSLVSGASFTGGDDPSLIPKLNGKVLIIKDFTTIITMMAMARDEIFGQLRDAYDGRIEKQFGNGVYRKYESTFGIIAGVTPIIDTCGTQGLGERFLKYRMDVEHSQQDEDDRIMRAIDNVNMEVGMREALGVAAARFLANEMPEQLPTLTFSQKRKVVSLAKLAARLRGVVNRDKYNTGLLTSKSSHEIGTRLAKQFMKLAFGIAIYYGEETIGKRTMRLMAKVALDSVPDKMEEVLRALYELSGLQGKGVTIGEVAKKSKRLTQSTVYRAMDDLLLIGVAKREKHGDTIGWSLSDHVRDMIAVSKVFEYVPRGKAWQATAKKKGVVIVRSKKR